MTSGKFQALTIDGVFVDRDDRQRREMRNIEELAESIQRLGLINPIVVQRSGQLVAGERRLTACRLLGWTMIPVQYTDDLSEYELQCIELEENVKREDLTWQEEVAAIERFHKMKLANEPTWSQAETAAALGYSSMDIGRKLSVAANLHNETIAGADRLSTAVNIVKRDSERKKTSALAEVAVVAAQATHPDETPEEVVERTRPVIPIQLTDFHEWQESYAGPKFNLIHCDFPYGINVADAPRMSSSIKDHYEDSPDIFWSLLARLGLAMDNVVAESAHLIFWHSMKFHVDTKQELERMGWNVHPFPLIWHKSDGMGIAPDPQRGPRQTYEAAFFAHRGDRKLTSAGCKANSFSFPGSRDGAIHVSEKPYPMLKHFMQMVCDEYSLVLDPTCGSGNALKVAQDLGANHVLGLEQMKEFYTIACDNWEKR